MAEIIAVGEPASEYQRRVIRVLRDALPADYRVFHDVELSVGLRGYEVDVVVMAPHAFYLLAVRGWSGEIRGDALQWWLLGDRYFDSPLEALERRRNIFQLLLDRAGYKHGVSANLHTFAMVVLASQRAVPRLDDPRAAAQVVPLAELPRVLQDASRVPRDWPLTSLGERAGLVADWLRKQLRPARSRDTLGFYKILSPLEETDEYRAYLGQHRFIPTESAVRLKVFQLDPYATDAERSASMQALFRDITAHRALGDHPAILSATELFAWQNDEYVLVSRWRPGRYLAGHTHDAVLSQHARIAVAADVASALAHAHRRGVLHRAVSPTNVLVDTEGRGALMNFDLARVEHPRVSTLVTPARGAMRTPYTAPEVLANGMHAATPRSDLYALGVTLYHALTGELPASADRVAGYAGAHPRLRGGAEPPLADVRHVLAHLCAFDPAARYQDAEQAAEDLRVLSTSWA